jgi:predicted nucleic acid-binding protein
MAAESYQSGLLDTNILILRKWIDPGELPAAVAISAITLAELSAGPHEVRPGSEQKDYEEHAERARRLDILQRAENEFDPIPFGVEAARAYGGSHRRRAQAPAPGRGPDDRVGGHRRGPPPLHHQSGRLRRAGALAYGRTCDPADRYPTRTMIVVDKCQISH